LSGELNGESLRGREISADITELGQKTVITATADDKFAEKVLGQSKNQT
jgi:hypothetical protein